MSSFKPATGGGQKPTPQKAKPTPPPEEKRPRRFFRLPQTWLLIAGLIVIIAGYFFGSGLLGWFGTFSRRLAGIIDVRHWQWWYYCVFLLIFVLAVKCVLTTWNWKSHDTTERQTAIRFFRMSFVISFALLFMVFMHGLNISSGIASAFSDWARFGVFSWVAFSAFWIVFLLLAFVFHLIIEWVRLAFLGEVVLEPLPQKSAKPQIVKSVVPQTKGFNTSVQRPSNSFSSFSPRKKTSFWERWDISFLSENKTVILLGLGGIALLCLLGFFFYRFVTMQWIDSEGYPISKPWWLWALPFILLAIGGLVYKIVMIIRENAEDTASQPKNKPVSRPTVPKSRSFNMNVAGRGKFQSFGHHESKTNFFTSPIFWVIIGMSGFLVVGILLVMLFW